MMSLLNKIQALLNNKQTQECDTTRILQLAQAVLLIEISHADFETDPKELKAAATRLARRHKLSPAEADTLINDALTEHQQSVSLHDYLTAINNAFDQNKKAELIEDLWAIAYADGKLDCHEEHQVRKIADLLHVPHVQFIKAKHRVQKSQGGRE